MTRNLVLLLIDKSEIVNDIHFSSGLSVSDHLAYSAYLLCNQEIKILKQSNIIFIKMTMIQSIRNFSQLIVGNYTI